MTDFLSGIHASWPPAISAGIQVFFALAMAHFVATYHRLTPRPKFGRWSKPVSKFCQFAAALAWICAALGAATSVFGLMVALDQPAQGLALNDLGVFLSRLAGPVIMYHAAGMAWEFLKALKEKDRLKKRLAEAEARLSEFEGG